LHSAELLCQYVNTVDHEYSTNYVLGKELRYAYINSTCVLYASVNELLGKLFFIYVYCKLYIWNIYERDSFAYFVLNYSRCDLNNQNI
jgi:hypothetical protein